MDFLLTFRISGKPKPLKTSKPFRPEDVMTHNIYSWFVLLSHSTSWTYFQYFGIICRYIITTFTVSFYNKQKFSYYSISNWIFDLFFLIDFISSLLLWVFWHKNQGKLTEQSTALSRLLWRNKAYKPRRMYYLVLDVISLLPFEALAYVTNLPPAATAIFHCLALLRIYRIFFLFGEKGLEFSLATNVLQILLKFFVIGIVFTHSVTCLWYMMQDEEEGTSLYIAGKTIKFNMDEPIQWYLIAFYFVQTTFTNIGFGDITPKTDLERAFAILIAMLGFALINGYLIGALSSVLLEQARRLNNLQLRLSLMQTELEERKVPSETHKKIMRFYLALWITRKGAGSTNEMLNGLPSAMASEVYFDIFSPALKASLLFRSCDEHSQRAISRIMKINLYMAGDVILKRSEMNSQMFFIRKGTIQIMSYQDDETEIMTFGAGTVFGQCSLLLSLPAKSEVHAATFCEIHSLNRRNLFHTLIDYPSAKEIIFSVHRVLTFPITLKRGILLQIIITSVLFQNLILNMLADKFEPKVLKKKVEIGNILQVSSFYKTPLEASKLGRDDVCIITTFPYIFMPDTIFLKAWNILQGIIIVAICFYYPYCAAYWRRYPVESEALILLVDFMFIFDIYLTFFTAVNKENILLSTGRQIARERLRHVSVYIDIFAALPLYYFLPNSNRVKPVILCIRCLKLYKIPLLFAKVEYSLNQTVINVLRVVKYILYYLIGCYFMGMVYYMQACYYEVCNPDSWYAKPPVTNYTDRPAFISLYFAVMVISGTGYGDITVRNVQDIIWVINFYFPGVLLFCYIISEYSAHLSLAREPRQNFIELAARVNSFLTTNKMLPSERIRVRQYLNLQWEKNMGYEFVYGHDLFYDTPPHLYYDVNLQSRCRGIRDMVLFKGLGENIMNTILKSSFRRTIPPHEVVIYAGEVCSTLLIIEDGYCEVTYGRDVSVKSIIGPGSNISTVELFSGLTAMCHVRTLTHCVVVKVKKSDIRRALILNPVAARELELAIHEFKQFPIAKAFQKARPIRLHLAVRPALQDSVFRFRYYQKQSGNKELREPYMKLGLCQCIRFLLRSSTVLPYGKLLKKWELVRCFFAFCSAMIFPSLPYLELECPALYYIGWVLDVTAWIDLYFRVHVCYYNTRNLLVTHPLSTCGHYIKGSFALDFLFCFPFDRILYRRVYDANGETSASETSIDILRLLRVGQVHRIPATLMRLGQDFLSTPSLFLVTLMQTGFILVYITLLTSLLVLATCNYKVTANGAYRIVFPDETIGRHMMGNLARFNFTADPSKVYLINFYWVGLTSFSIGFGDFAATTQELMLFIIIIIVISYLYFNYVTIVIASHFSSINLNLTLYQKRLNHLIKFLRSENIEPLLKQHIINHFEFIWKKSRGMETELVFANFSLALKDDVMLHLYEETLRGVEPFAELHPSFFRILSSRLQEAYFQTGASVYKIGDIISHIFIIHQGEVTLVGKEEDQTAILWRSRLFGHLEPTERSVSHVSAVATKNLHILSIPTIELYHLLDSVHAKISENEDDDEKTTKDQTAAMLNIHNEAEEIEDADEKVLKRELLGMKKIWFIHTSYKFSKIVHVIFLIVAFISINLVSYHLAFQAYHWVVLGVSIAIEILYLMKIYIGFNTGFIDDNGEFVTDLKTIRSRYMRITGFYKDFFTIIPFEILAFLAPKEDRIYTATALRMTKILRTYEIWYFFNSKADTLNVNMVLLKLVSMSLATAIMYHQCTCAWFMVLCPKANCPDSITYQNIMNGKCGCIYLCCIYFVNLILTTTGYGDLTPKTTSEILFVLFLAYLARIYAATFIGQMVSTVQKSLYARTQYAFETETLKGFLSANDVSPKLRRTILNYANDLWRSEKGYQIPQLLANAPRYLISEIKLAAYGHHINDNLLFQKCDPVFRKHLINEFKRTIYYPGNVIVHEGEVNGTAYFIHSGQVGFRVHAKSGGSKVYVIDKFFGLAQGVRRRLPHYHTCFARSVCVILTLAVDDWDYLLDFYPFDIVTLYKEVGKLQKRQMAKKMRI